MTIRPFVGDQELLEQSVMALTTALAETAKGSDQQTVVLTVLAPMLGLAVGRGAYRLLSTRMGRFSDGYSNAFDNDPTKLQEHGDEHKDDPDYHEVMYRSFRQMLEAADPSAVEVIGYLAGQYTFANKKPDSYFRGLGRVLCDLEGDELADLATLLTGIQHANAEEGDEEIDLAIDWEITDMSTSEITYRQDIRVVLSADQFASIGEVRSASRLFSLLKRECLAETPAPSAKRRFPGGDQALLIRADMVERILGTIAPGEASKQ